ncbi:MAG TPA: serine/threonine-protein kinase [Pirellulaceae bacterium]|nr:serine/threonine-protein kinase [Pirellulaceae bacterium]
MDELTIFTRALDIASPAERAAFLLQACRADAQLLARVEALLQSHEIGGSFLQSHPVRGTPATVDPPLPEKPGTQIGPYNLLQQIGEGGMGVVYMAEQSEPVQRKVALKVIKPGMDSRQVIARFEAEKQALALMDHANIARVLDAGTTEQGRPYFVMELVHGVPITKYCDDNRLTPRERLELFVPVCQAIQHAHQKGIIHRDIKPSNVMVTLYDGKPVPKVIDFGVAKATEQKLTERTLFTQYGTMVGTLEYMSPEQAEMSALGVDTRSDIFSLGVLLYELLTGSTPVSSKRMKEAAYAEILRMIREEEAPKPSTRLSDSGEALASISANRHMEPAKLTKLVKGELDWIVMKCLEKDRNRRYETADGIAADVQRHLNDEPVQACPPSAVYRFGKFARRNTRALAAISVVALAMLLAVTALATSTVLISGALRAETQAKEKLRQDSYFHLIALAYRELSANNLKRARELLEECPEDLRQWEWHYLMRHCRVEPVFLQDTAAVNSIAFSADGKFLASAGGDGAIKVWNIEKGKVTQTLAKAHSDFACSVAFHPDGQHLASVGADNQVKVWDLTTSPPSLAFARPCDSVHFYLTAHAVAFNPQDGRQLAAGNDGEVTIWDWKDGRRLKTFVGQKKQRISVAFGRDGRRLATGNWAGSVRLWDAQAEGQPLCAFSETRYPVGGLAFDNDGRRLATASFNRHAEVWDTTTGRGVHTLPHTTGLVLGVAFSLDGRRIASSGEDKTVRIWDAMTGREVLSLRGHAATCGCLAFSPDGRRLASASEDKTIRIWDATPLQGHEGQESLSLPYSNEIWSVAVSPDGKQIASAGWSMPVKIRSTQTGQETAELPGHKSIGFCVAWQPDGNRIAAAGGNGPLFSVKVWDVNTQREVFTVPERPSATEIPAVTYSPDGQYLVTGSKDGTVRVWDARNGQTVGTLGTHDREVRAVVFSRDGSHLVSASGGGKVKVWAWAPTRLGLVQKPQFECQARMPGVYVNVAFSPDCRCLVTSDELYTIKIWDVQTGGELETLRGHTGDVCAVAFSSDGRWLATAGEDTTVRIWDALSWKPLHTLRGHTAVVSSLAFVPKTHRLVSGSRDHTVKVWDLTRWEQVPDR